MQWRWKAWKATYPKNQGTAIAESWIFLSDDNLVGQAKGHGNFLKRRVRMKGVAALHWTNVKGNPEMPHSCDEIQYSHCAKTQRTALMILDPLHQNHLCFTIWPSTCRTWKLVVKQQLTYIYIYIYLLFPTNLPLNLILILSDKATVNWTQVICCSRLMACCTEAFVDACTLACGEQDSYKLVRWKPHSIAKRPFRHRQRECHFRRLSK